MNELEDAAALRPLLFSIAYRMTSSVNDAEDIVQEAFLRYGRARSDGTRIDSAKAFLSTITTRLAIDMLRSSRVRRETYIGQWLPEPILSDGEEPESRIELAESLSMAFLLLLERLSPLERAAFILHDVFGYGYDELASILDRREASCRQLVSRARRHVRAGRPRFDPSRRDRDRLARRFLAAVAEGDVDGLVKTLAADVVVTGDGGGKAPQWGQPIVGADRVARLLAGLGRRFRRSPISIEPCHVNGQPGAIIRDGEGRIATVWSIEIADGAVQAVRSVVNPDKIRHLGPVTDLRALMRAHPGREPADRPTAG